MTVPRSNSPGGARRLLLAWLLVASYTALSCSDDPFGPRTDALQDARGRWRAAELSEYSFIYHQSCFCPLTQPLRITVRQGVVVSAEDAATGTPVSPAELGFIPTIDDLFDRLAEALEAEPAQFEVEYDPVLGYPRSATVDISRQIADEEFSFTVTGLEPAGS